MKKRRWLCLSVLLVFLLSMCACNYEYLDDEFWDVRILERFGDGRVQVQRWRAQTYIEEVDGVYTYSVDRYKLHSLKFYKLEDQKTDKCIQHTLYDYVEVDDWLYTYGTSHYVKVNFRTMDMVQYKTFEEIPPAEQAYFASLSHANPVKAVDLIDGDNRYENCEVTVEGDILYNGKVITALNGKTYKWFDIVSCDCYYDFDYALWRSTYESISAS